jgi:DNA-binding MarR family transcriptional regulator
MVYMMQTLRFDGSIWCNLDVALRQIDQYYRHMIRPEGLSVIEWYVLRALYETDGQHASALANAVGRAATSFTPNLDKLVQKGFIERRQDDNDRRAVCIYLTQLAQDHREEIIANAAEVDGSIRAMFNDDHFDVLQQALNHFQAIHGAES